MASQTDTGTVAYFSMEIALDPAVPTYSGGLGVLAGDTLRAAADLRIPMVGVTLLHRKGYFRQQLDQQGNQSEWPVDWLPQERLEALSPRVPLTIEGRTVWVGAWRYVIRGVSGHEVPVYLLDTGLPDNEPQDRAFTDQLYGGDERYRLCQEAILGIGGIGILRALGYQKFQAYHMNEGHSALLTLALLKEATNGGGIAGAGAPECETVRHHCVFTTHTPVPAGHDQFPLSLVRDTIGDDYTRALGSSGCCLDHTLNMTHLALFFSRYVNGVAMRHGQVSRGIFPNYPINSITNGVHAVTWTSQPFQMIFDRHIPEWRHDNLNLRYAVDISLDEIRGAHAEAKQQLLAEVERRSRVRLDPQAFTIGFARRATPYKRADLFVSDPGRLRHIARQVGPLQVIYAGKAHPRDNGGKDLIRLVCEASAALSDVLTIVYLEEYDMELGKHLCAGVDLWLNTPKKPQEASGTSGMKAALNGVPSFSVLDGWWIEGHVEGVTGWSIGDGWQTETNTFKETESLYLKLENEIMPMFYGQPAAYARVMRSAIALNGSFFNAQRMVLQYLGNAYRSS